MAKQNKRLITSTSPDTWQDLQNEVARILEQCGFNVEIEKIVETVRGEVEIDVYAEEIIRGRKYSIICECKNWKTAVPQQIIHAFRTVVGDIGSNIGYIISSGGFQSGSFRASELTNLKLLNWQEFQDEFEQSWYESYFSPTIADELGPLLTYAEPLLPRWFHDLPEEEKENYMSLKRKYEEFGWAIMTFTPYSRMLRKDGIPELPLVEKLPDDSKILENVPQEILEQEAYQEFLDDAIVFGQEVIEKFRAIRDRNAA
ncbi:restriction endonuclease [Fodinibius halophilus]|uniref:Restriction endonuclease n=1 Tax=Fodinibius halophilus TaxID=1736908 RepID=A0A6M1T842_9BACT|nr:restriction endonuclease [Fodinibius halophilus]NGP90249.1 restriction endonuclease [Fodinibius halophilus]